MSALFDKCGGYRALHSFTHATLIHVGTIAFCKRFIPYQEDPLGKTSGQMIGAARSGRQNIIEGSERAATSKETEIKLTDVARASLGELLGDLEIYLAERGAIPWSRSSEPHRKLSAIQLETFAHTDDELHDYWVYFGNQRAKFAAWLDNGDGTVVANTLVVLIQRAMAMLSGQVRHLGETFAQQGGFRERMHQCRTEVRNAAAASDAPICPDCGKPMRLRKAKTGEHAGQPFWGCSGYPECKGTRPAHDEAVSKAPSA
jgi:four helix bundle suffix protein